MMRKPGPSGYNLFYSVSDSELDLNNINSAKTKSDQFGENDTQSRKTDTRMTFPIQRPSRANLLRNWKNNYAVCKAEDEETTPHMIRKMVVVELPKKLVKMLQRLEQITRTPQTAAENDFS